MQARHKGSTLLIAAVPVKSCRALELKKLWTSRVYLALILFLGTD